MVMQGARRNGLQWPPGAFQVASWVVFVFFVATFYALEFLYTDTVGRAVAGAIYGVLAVGSFIAGSIATVEDPADRNIYEAEPKWAPREVVPGHLYCYRCERHVKDTSKHCTICQKCVDVFDHHCLWLSNCVGTHNYK
jgi:palmitoyltransferase ZDHHC1/11